MASFLSNEGFFGCHFRRSWALFAALLRLANWLRQYWSILLAKGVSPPGRSCSANGTGANTESLSLGKWLTRELLWWDSPGGLFGAFRCLLALQFVRNFDWRHYRIRGTRV